MAAKKVKKRFFKSRQLIILLSVLLAIIFLVILFNQGFIGNPLENFGKGITKVVAPDECTIIAGNLLHTIEDEGDCNLKCVAECEIRTLELEDSEFMARPNNCNICTCSCK